MTATPPSARRHGVSHRESGALHAQMLRQAMPMPLQWPGEGGRRLRHAWSQRHMRTPGIVMLHPCCQKDDAGGSTVKGITKSSAFPPQRADEPFTEGIGLRTLRRRFQDPVAPDGGYPGRALGRKYYPGHVSGNGSHGQRGSLRAAAAASMRPWDAQSHCSGGCAAWRVP